MNLISGTHHSYEKREHTFIILREYTIIFLQGETNELIVTRDWSHKTLNIVILVETLNIV